MVTNLRLPGQYDERLLASIGLQGPFYNWNRWYLPSMGRYMELDPIAMAGELNGPFTPEWYTYVGASPNRYVDPTGLAYFGKRPLGGLPWLWIISNNPLDDWFNTEVSHEQLFFEDGKNPANIGYFEDSKLRTESNPKDYRQVATHYNDCVMRMAASSATAGQYSVIANPFALKPQNNCQDWNDRVRQQYDRLIKIPSVRAECRL